MIEKFKIGDSVRYIPTHAHGDKNHKDCEDGTITSTNERFVFVRYLTEKEILKITPQATNEYDLIKINNLKGGCDGSKDK